MDWPVWRGRRLRVDIFSRMLIALLLVALLPMTVFWQFERVRMIKDGRADAREKLQLFSDRVTQQIDDWAHLNISVMQVAASQAAMRSMNPVLQRRAILALMPQLPWAYLLHTVDLTGMNVARSDEAPRTSYRDRAYFKQILAGRPYADEVQIGRTSHRPAFLLAVPIFGTGGRLRGLLIEAATLDQVTDAVTSAHLGRTGYAFLMTPDGTLIADARESLRRRLKNYHGHPAYLDAQRGDGTYRYILDGVARVAQIQHTQLGWISVVQQDAAENLAAVHQANRNALLLLGLTGAFVTVFSAVVARHFAASIEEATRAATAISRGQFDFVVDTRRSDEIGDLMRAMQGVRHTLGSFLGTQRRMAEAAARGDFSERGDETGFHHVYADMVRHLNTLMETADREFAELAVVLGAIAHGDLTVSMRGEHQGTFAALQRDINTTVRSLSTSIRDIELHRNLLRATLEHLPQGISVVDRDLNIIAWNRRYEEIFAYPRSLLRRGVSVRELMDHNATRGLMGAGEPGTLIARRLEQLRRNTPYSSERRLPDGTVLEIRGNAVPEVGYVTSFSDVTAYKRTEQELRTMTESLERYVQERTRDLQLAKAEAEQANRSKTRFVAAAVHDLMQPLNAARLFASAARAQLREPGEIELIDGVERALDAEDAILGSLLDISRLESGSFEVHEQDLPLAPFLQQLAREFGILARSRQIDFRFVTCRAVVRSDESLLRRILQNFLSNALQYTARGRILFGCRRVAGDVRIEVWDTGPGIAEEHQVRIFREFERLDVHRETSERRAGLGLAIVERIGRRLGHPIALRSWVGRGSVFSVRVPCGGSECAPVRRIVTSAADRASLAGKHIWCLDDDPQILEGIRALLSQWGCEVTVAESAERALELAARSGPPNVLLLDYRLRAGTGPEVVPALFRCWGAAVAVIVISAETDPAVRESILARGWTFLAKPVRPSRLRALMNHALTRSAAQS
ncbi:MAG TPA: NahK/ErcS family hybrid sensor histidine kinase/response regulator [Steroidobacteraceae bacterium]|nr:NahK/ErcS family hybrid sensor histidine kinase/response regulator [Steroidobacteraceae bacterium]